MMWVVDASVAVRWVLGDESHPDAEHVLRRLVRSPTQFAVPELFAFETFTVLGRLHPRPLEAFQAAIHPHLVGGMLRYPMTAELAADASELMGFGLTGYDAAYAALARRVGGRWLTFDSSAHRRIKQLELSFLLGFGLPEGWLSEPDDLR